MSDEVFSCLARSDLPWECTNCGFPNISASLFDSSLSDSSSSDRSDVTIHSNRSSTSSQSSDVPGSPPAHSSSPTKSNAKAKTVSNLRTLTINFQSIYGKREVFWSLVDATKPDIIFGCETWLKPDVSQGEFFPPCFTVYRKDRKDGYGGVLVGIHSSLMSQEIDVDSETELVAAKILCGKQNIIGAMYRPPRTKQAYMEPTWIP